MVQGAISRQRKTVHLSPRSFCQRKEETLRILIRINLNPVPKGDQRKGTLPSFLTFDIFLEQQWDGTLIVDQHPRTGVLIQSDVRDPEVLLIRQHYGSAKQQYK